MSGVMGDPKTVLEGSVKYRDKKKWKSRWAVVSKLSPVADCLHIQLYRDSKERCKRGPTKASLSLEGFLGLEAGFTLDKESNTMALVCTEVVVVLAFDSREVLIQWQVKIRAHLVEEQHFLVQIAHVPTKSKLPCGPARLHLQDHTFCLVSGVPPRLLATWPLKELRRFGVVEGKFCFEGGSLCGKGEGLHVLLTNQCEEMSQAMDLASKGKLQGKRKTLARKNSLLETSARMPLHKRCDSRSTTGDSSRPLLTSGSEASSTCDACSEILRACGDDLVYAPSSISSMKASSCRIHYRWPSCLSRWGQSSTTTASDVDSVDTVSVILSDFHSSQSTTLSKTNGHGQSLSCLCDTQGTWPFNECTKCGKHFYGQVSLQPCKGKPATSPDNLRGEEPNGFSPQWTMDSLVGSTTPPSKKDSIYQLNPPSDRSSLCSRASHSSSASAASSSGSEYSIPKSYLETLYDRPKNMQYLTNCKTNGKVSEQRQDPCQLKPADMCAFCTCQGQTRNWSRSAATKPHEKHDDSCTWNRMTAVNGRKSANPSPSSSPKKMKKNGTNGVKSSEGDGLDCDIACTCGKSDPYLNYAVPRSSTLLPRDMQGPCIVNGTKDVKPYLPVMPSEDYDVPKKFADMLSNCDMMQKSAAIKNVNNGPSCSCMSACKMIPNMELFKIASKHSYGQPRGAILNAVDSMHMCACQRVMLWAGSLVPCLGPQRPALETGWNGAPRAALNAKGCDRPWYNNQTVAVCSEPHKSAEIVMVNGKLKHVLRDVPAIPAEIDRLQTSFRPRANTISYPVSSRTNEEGLGGFNCSISDFSTSCSNEKVAKVFDAPDSISANYANLEFADTLSLYENSGLVLSRLESCGEKNEVVCADKPPLPPRSNTSDIKKAPNSSKNEIQEFKPRSAKNSPKKSPLKHTNGSAYELMSYENNPFCRNDEDYLLMEPIYMKDNKNSQNPKSEPESTTIVPSDIDNSNTVNDSDVKSTLPLRPFMPFSFPNSGNVSPSNSEVNSNDLMLRKNQLINDELQIRSNRSNSFSELKKLVLMRKRSSSMDGKNNGYQSKDSGVESVPASPISSPRSSAQRKYSLFSKLSLRSKEKSMSTNEISLPAPLPTGNTSPNMMLKNNFHRSADCLKLSEEYANSDDELNSDNSDFTIQKDNIPGLGMKRSSSVPCRSALPSGSIQSPVGAAETIMELNDLNKESSSDAVPECLTDSAQEHVQRKYSLDSHVRSKQRLHSNSSNCDNNYGHEQLDEQDTIMEMQGVLRRNHTHVERDRSATSSCSSSDISDYMESLSFISRSSSSSSGSADYMRSDEIYLLKSIPKLPARNNPPCSNSISVPGVHQGRLPVDVDASSRSVHRRSLNDSSDGSSTGVYQDQCFRKQDANSRPCASGRCNRNSRSSTSSSSSLSTSPGVTDYSSSTSSSSVPGQNSLPPKPPQAKRLTRVKAASSTYLSLKDESKKT